MTGFPSGPKINLFCSAVHHCLHTKLDVLIEMPKADKMARKGQKYYAVRVGRTPGVYDTWEETEKQVCPRCPSSPESEPSSLPSCIGQTLSRCPAQVVSDF